MIGLFRLHRLTSRRKALKYSHDGFWRGAGAIPDRRSVRSGEEKS